MAQTLQGIVDEFIRYMQGGSNPNGSVLEPRLVMDKIPEFRNTVIRMRMAKDKVISSEWQQTFTMPIGNLDSTFQNDCLCRFVCPQPLTGQSDWASFITGVYAGGNMTKHLMPAASYGALQTFAQAAVKYERMYAFDTNWLYLPLRQRSNRAIVVSGVFHNPMEVPGFTDRLDYPVSPDLLPEMRDLFLKTFGITQVQVPNDRINNAMGANAPQPR
jgi:hypothetical protein